MSNEVLLMIANASVVPLWALLALAPRHAITERVVHSGAFVPVLTLAYAALLLTDVPGPQGANFTTLEGVRNIFTSDRTVIACWVHYLLLDLFAGAWEARDAARLEVSRWVVLPCLVATWLYGPVGLCAWWLTRGALRRRWTLGELTTSSS